MLWEQADALRTTGSCKVMHGLQAAALEAKDDAVGEIRFQNLSACIPLVRHAVWREGWCSNPSGLYASSEPVPKLFWVAPPELLS